MRPLLNDDNLAGRPRSSDSITRGQASSMTYFMADEKTIESASRSHSVVFPKPRNSVKKANYGVESYDTMTTSLIRNTNDLDEKPASLKLTQNNSSEKQASFYENGQVETAFLSFKNSPENSRNGSPCRPQNSISRPFTPLSSHSPAIASSPSSSESRIISDTGYYTDDIRSQDMNLKREEELAIGSQESNDGSTPQFVMPSIKMPSRRPFTEKGRNLGRLKVLIAGDSGIGKTSLVKAIVQICEDIVHVDPIRVTSPNLRKDKRKIPHKTKSKTQDIESTSKITEIYASTRPYPVWWTDLEESQLIKRRRGLEDTVLERNLCFVDTPGYGNKASQLECISFIIDYVESHFKKLSSFEGSNESEMINMLSGNGGSQVDVVFYLISNGVKTIDIEYMRKLSQLTNIIPLISQADKLEKENISSVKRHVMNQLHSAKIKPFLFELNSNTRTNQNSTQISAPYAVSCKASRDLETMDASLLMSPDYVQPLIESELKLLVSRIFERDSISWLRHAAAKKYINWRSSSNINSISQSIYQPLTTLSSSEILTAPVDAITSYTVARITDHTQREERIAQVRLANWAAKLQRSLQNERSRFENLARNERAVWLTERLGECIQDGTIIPLSQAQKDKGICESKFRIFAQSDSCPQHSINTENINTNDPLGILALTQELGRKGWVIIKVVSSLGIISGLVYWATQAWHEEWLVYGF